MFFENFVSSFLNGKSLNLYDSIQDLRLLFDEKETFILSIEISMMDPKEQPAFAKLLLKKSKLKKIKINLVFVDKGNFSFF